MINVSMVGPDLNARGGMATVECNILEALDPQAVSVRFFPTYEDGSALKKLAVFFKAYRACARSLKSADVLHVHMASRGSFARKRVFINRAFREDVPVVAHLHGSEFAVWYDKECNEAGRAEICKTLDKCARVVLLSDEWMNFFIHRNICPRDKLIVLNNAVNIPHENTTDYFNKTVLFMGRLDDRKNPGALIHAAVSVISEHPDVRFVFAGDGEVQRYKELACGLGISDNCTFTGWVSDKEKSALFCRASVFCLPSRNEGMPMSVLEAMSHGLACVATPVGGIPQIIQHGTNGFLVPGEGIDELAEIISSLLSQPLRKMEIGKAGRETICNRFCLDRYVSHLTDIYREVATR